MLAPNGLVIARMRNPANRYTIRSLALLPISRMGMLG